MCEPVGAIVRAEAGHDRDGLFCVVGQNEGYLLLADGKRRRVAAPKRKNPRHVKTVSGAAGAFEHPAIQKLTQGQPVTDRELRRALAAFKEEITLGER